MSFSLFCLSPVLYLGINFSQTSFSPISPTSPNPLPLKCTTGNCANALHQVKEGAGTRYALSGSTGGKRIGENKRREYCRPNMKSWEKEKKQYNLNSYFVKKKKNYKKNCKTTAETFYALNRSLWILLPQPVL